MEFNLSLALETLIDDELKYEGEGSGQNMMGDIFLKHEEFQFESSK